MHTRYARRLPLALTLVATALLLNAGPAGAQTDGTTDPSTPVGGVLTLSNSWVYVITALVLPFVIGLLQKDSNPGWVKVALATAVGTVATAFIELITPDGAAIISQEFLLKALVTIGGAMFSYANVWKPIADGRFNTDRIGGLSPGPERRTP